MFNKHKHQWVEQARRFTPELGLDFKIKSSNPEQFREILYGYTIIEQKCTDCGKVDFDKVYGDQR